MNTYKIVFRPKAKRQYLKLNHDVQARINAAINELANNPRPFGYLKMKDKSERYRIRVGGYRVIYEIHDKIITVVIAEIDNRKNIYR